MREDIVLIFNKYPDETITGEGISNENIEELENILKVRLPDSYKDYLKTFGYGGIFGRYILGVENPPNSGSVIEYTKEWTQQGLPKGFVVIEDVHEFLFCLNTNEFDQSSECPVVVYLPHESQPSYSVMYSSFEEYLDDCIQDGLDNLD